MRYDIHYLQGYLKIVYLVNRREVYEIKGERVLTLCKVKVGFLRYDIHYLQGYLEILYFVNRSEFFKV